MKKVAFSSLLSLVIFSPLWAAHGGLDQSFGNKGYVAAPPGPGTVAVAQQADGKLVAVGQLNKNGSTRIIRYQTNGTLDATFGGTSVVVSSIIIANDLLVQPADGKIVVAGWDQTAAHGLLMRFNPNGSLDTRFGINGLVTGPNGLGLCLALKQDGTIILGGTDNNGSIQVTSYNPDGSLNTSFDGSVQGAAYRIAAQADGSVYAAGSDTNTNFQLVHYNKNGSLDTNFGNNGIATGPAGVVCDVAIQSNGKIVVGGIDGSHNFMAVRFNNDGSIDNSFGKSGIASGPAGDCYKLLLQKDGKILLIGNQNGGQAQLMRFTTAGKPDTSFGTKGIAAGPQGRAFGATLQADGNIVVVGCDQKFNNAQIARYLS